MPQRQFDFSTFHHFQVVGTIPEELEGVTPYILADLHDLVRKFGLLDEEEHTYSMGLNVPVEVYVLISSRPKRYSMCIIGPGGTTSSGANVLSMEGGEVVVWGRITIADIDRFIEMVDSVMAKKGYIDPETGERLATNMVVEPGKYKVDEVFSQQGSAMATMSGGPDAETLRQRFDRPELVAIVKHKDGLPSLCHVRDLDYMRRREIVAQKVLARVGIKSIEDMDMLSWDDIQDLRQLIEVALAKLDE